jgi:hypothetical protein
MGMFDNIEFDINRLPISVEERKLLSKKKFQTKSLENTLSRYRITEDGHLEYLVYCSDFLDQYEPDCQFESWIRINDIHGYVSFYTFLSDPKEWYEFVAKFTDGKLVDLFRNQGKTFAGNRREN